MFSSIIDNYSWEEIKNNIYSKTSADVESALNKEYLTPDDFMALISPAGASYLEPMAALSRKYTQQRFGKTIQFYVPLYLTNSCTNCCIYCGFNHNNKINRIILTEQQMLDEFKAIKELGNFEHILLVTGEDPRNAGVDYLEKAVKLAHEHFASVSLEVQPLKMEEYKRLRESGLNTVYVYQETYNKDNYRHYHPKGMKSNYNWRLDTFDRMGQAGIHKMGLGVLIGLEDWRTDTAMMAIHLRYLQKHYWQTKYSISFPRMRPHTGAFQPNVVISDREFAQLIWAFRLFDHDIEMALSTRESAKFRDNMITLGITNMSAGSKTDPGGYFTYPDSLEQFSVNDDRSPQEVEKVIEEHNYEVVWKDWDRAFD